MKNSKRFLTLLLTLVMLVGVFTVAASAAEVKIDVIFDTNGDGLNDTYDNASFVESSDAKVELKSFEGCTAWTANGSGSYAVGSELGWNELIAIAPSGGTVVFAPIAKAPTTVPSTPLEPALPSNPTDTKKYDLSIDYYGQINFTGFEKLVDAVGGVTVYSDQAFRARNTYISVGENNLNGSQALDFSRERYNVSGGDNGRGKNQMKIVKAVIEKLTNGTTIISR